MNYVTRGIVASMLAVIPLQATACDWVYHLASYHTDRDLIEDVNELNPGIGITCDVTGGAVEFGTYQGSFGDQITYIIGDINVFGEDGGVFVGAAHGYGDHLLVPGMLGGAWFDIAPARIRVAPSYNPETGTPGAVFGLSFKF